MVLLSSSSNILAYLDASSTNSLVQVYTPPQETVEGDPPKVVKYSGLIEELKVRIKIDSILAREPPSFPIEASNSEMFAGVREWEWSGQRYELRLFLRNPGGSAVQVGAIALHNRQPYYVVELLQFLAQGTHFRIGPGCELLAKFHDIGYGYPTGTDNLTIFGSVAEEATYHPTTDLIAISRESFTVSAFGLRYSFDTSATDTSGMVGGQLRANGDILATTTALYINRFDRNQVEVSTAIDRISNGSTIQIQADTNPVSYHYFALTASPTLNGNIYTLAVNHLGGNGSLNGAVSLSFGGLGAAGPQGLPGADGADGADGAPGVGGFGVPFTYAAGGSPAPAGELRFNNSPNAATALYVSETSLGGADITAVLDYLEPGAILQVTDRDTPQSWYQYTMGAVSGAGTGSRTIALSPLAGSGTLTGEVSLSFTLPGQPGTPGSVSAASSLALAHIATPAAPGAGTLLYAKADGNLYTLPAGGVEQPVSPSGTGIPVVTLQEQGSAPTPGEDELALYVQADQHLKARRESSGDIVTFQIREEPEYLWIPAGAITPATTNGASTGTVETTTNAVCYDCLDFDAATIEYGHFNVTLDNWDAGTFKAYFVWTADSGSGDVVWGLQALALADNEALDTAFGTTQTVTDTLSTVGTLRRSSATSSVTASGTPVSGGTVFFRIYRNATDGGDTLAVDARLTGIGIEYFKTATEVTAL